MKKLRVSSLEAWSPWLGENHDKEDGVWLVFRKKGAGPIPFSYEEALEDYYQQVWDCFPRT